MNNRPRNKAKANNDMCLHTLEKLEAMNTESLEKLKLIGINLPEELLKDTKVSSLLGEENE